MTAAIWLVDYENVQKLDVAGIPSNAHLKVFVGAKQTKIPTALVRLRESLKDRFEFVWIEETASNALDFHIACHLGEAMAHSSGAEFIIVSNDKDFDPLVRHLASRGIKCRRKGQGAASMTPAPSGSDSPAEQVLAYLREMEKAKRPRKRQSLINHMTTHFQKKLSGAHVTAAIDELVKSKQILESGRSLTYDF